jgi:hypothetical protein
MFFKRKESKGWHPCLVITVGALAMVGAISVANNTKGLIMKAKDKMMSVISGCGASVGSEGND